MEGIGGPNDLADRPFWPFGTATFRTNGWAERLSVAQLSGRAPLYLTDIHFTWTAG